MEWCVFAILMRNERHGLANNPSSRAALLEKLNRKNRFDFDFD